MSRHTRPPRDAGGPHLDESRLEQVAEEVVEAFDETVEAVLPRRLRARAWAKRRPITNALWRAGVLVLGLVLVVAGLAMLVFPGPGWAAIILGLVVLASEYAWAHRLLEPVKRWAMRAKDAALDPRVRRRNLILLAGALVLAAAGAVWYVAVWGVTLDGVEALRLRITGG